MQIAFQGKGLGYAIQEIRGFNIHGLLSMDPMAGCHYIPAVLRKR
jgi:hypothetical protein